MGRSLPRHRARHTLCPRNGCTTQRSVSGTMFPRNAFSQDALLPRGVLMQQSVLSTLPWRRYLPELECKRCVSRIQVKVQPGRCKQNMRGHVWNVETRKVMLPEGTDVPLVPHVWLHRVGLSGCYPPELPWLWVNLRIEEASPVCGVLLHARCLLVNSLICLNGNNSCAFTTSNIHKDGQGPSL